MAEYMAIAPAVEEYGDVLGRRTSGGDDEETYQSMRFQPSSWL